MITIPSGVRVPLATWPVDFRKGAHGLAALASAVLGEDPFSGVVVVFLAKRGAFALGQARRPGEDPRLGCERPGSGVELRGFILHFLLSGVSVLIRLSGR